MSNLIGISNDDTYLLLPHKDLFHMKKTIRISMNILLDKMTLAVANRDTNTTINISTHNIAIYILHSETDGNELNIHTTIANNGRIKIKEETRDQSERTNLSHITLPKEFLSATDALACVVYRTSFSFPPTSSSKQVRTVVQGIFVRKTFKLHSPILLNFQTLSKNQIPGANRICGVWEESKLPNCRKL